MKALNIILNSNEQTTLRCDTDEVRYYCLIAFSNIINELPSNVTRVLKLLEIRNFLQQMYMSEINRYSPASLILMCSSELNPRLLSKSRNGTFGLDFRVVRSSAHAPGQPITAINDPTLLITSRAIFGSDYLQRMFMSMNGFLFIFIFR